MKRLCSCNPLLQSFLYASSKFVVILPLIVLIFNTSSAQNFYNFSSSSPFAPIINGSSFFAVNTWEYANSSGEPSPRHECSYVEAGGKFYLIGGRGNPALSIYNPQTNSWSTGTNIPNGKELHHFQAVT